MNYNIRHPRAPCITLNEKLVFSVIKHLRASYACFVLYYPFFLGWLASGDLVLWSSTVNCSANILIGPLQDPVTWYGINYTGTQMTQWDFQNKRTLTSPAGLSFVMEVPLRHLRSSVIYSVLFDWILQRAY